MKYSELEEALFGLKEKMTELQAQHQALREAHALPKTVLCDGYTFSARWRVSPDEGLTYSMQFHRGRALVFEFVHGELFKTPSAEPVPNEVFKRAQEVQQLLEKWLTDRIDWPFNQEEFPRVQ